MKKFLLASALCFLALILAAHEFWLDPGKFYYRKGDTMKLQFLVGEDFKGENWTGNRSKVKSLTLTDEVGTHAVDAGLSENKGDSLSLVLNTEGTQMISYNSNNSFISLPAKEFNAYLAEDGLNDAINYRKQFHEIDSTGRELYQRSVKTIFQVGEKYSSVFAKPTGLPLDLIPLRNPYQLSDDDSLTVRVLFEGKPLVNQFMVVWHRNREIFLKVQYRTNNQGEFRFPVMTKSKWMVSTVKMVRLKDNAQADWQSYWASLTWGYN